MSVLYLAAIASAVTMVPTAPDQPRQARVGYADLNLASTKGQQTLDRRLRRALDMVCGTTAVSLKEFGEVRKCRKNAMAQIEPQRQAAIANAGRVRVAITF